MQEIEDKMNEAFRNTFQTMTDMIHQKPVQDAQEEQEEQEEQGEWAQLLQEIREGRNISKQESEDVQDTQDMQEQDLTEEDSIQRQKEELMKEFPQYDDIVFDDSLIDSFPYASIRDVQQTILEKLKKCNDKKFIVIEAPPGTGKSGIAKTILSHFKHGYVITATKQLQDQYASEFRDMKVIKGKSNYTCAFMNVSCAEADCARDSMKAISCRLDNICPYHVAKREAAFAYQTIMSYAFLFTFINDENPIFSSRNTLILDECHLIESQMISWASIILNVSKLQEDYKLVTGADFSDDTDKYMKITATDFDEGYTQNNAVFIKLVFDELKKKLKEMNKDLSSRSVTDALLIAKYSTGKSKSTKAAIQEIIKKRDNISQLVEKIKVFYSSDKNEWFIAPRKNEKDNTRELVIQPLYVNELFRKYIERFGRKHIVFMSATILNVRKFCEELGIARDEVGIIKVGSTFDPAKSPIYFFPCGKMNYKEIDATLPVAIKKIKEILEKHKHECGIIHTGNYKIADEIYKKLRQSRLVIRRSRETNEELLERHKRTKYGVLVSPSLNTGTDLKDDLSRFQIIVKLPFMSLADKRVKKKADLDGVWYNCEMLRTLIQASGRSTRSEEDYSVTYVLDSSFHYYVDRYRGWLPDYFVDRITW